MRRRTCRLALAAVVGLALAPVLPAGAELPPEVYKRMQEQAPEVLRITVQRVSQKRSGKMARVMVTAKVDRVLRSKTGVKTGAVIRIPYETRVVDDGRVGPRPIPVLGEGKRYTAYLSREPDAQYFYPAARGASFETR